jgi:hypothetical protein
VAVATKHLLLVPQETRGQGAEARVDSGDTIWVGGLSE